MSPDTHPSLSAAIPPGWYPDPAGGGGKRWWDGAAWTQNVQDPEAPPPAPSFGTYVPAQLRPTQPIVTAEVGVGYTRASWWIAGSPLWVVIPQVAIAVTITTLAQNSGLSLGVGITLLTALAWGILVRLAFADRAELLRRGNATTASPWWTLLTPLVYLILRAREVRLYASGGWATVVWWCLAAFVTPGVSVLAVFAVYGLVAN